MLGHCLRLALRLAGLSGAIMLAAPATATQSDNGFQVIEDFEGYPAGTLTIDFPFGLVGALSGGSVEAGTAAFPPSSGTQVYLGGLISFSLADPFNDSWPAVWANITSSDPVVLRVWQYDYVLGDNVLFREIMSPAGLENTWFGTGSELDPLGITRFEYSSAHGFAIDDLTLGLLGVPPGIPEPATWAMLIAGFGLVGAAARRRQFATV
jgi:hypothetical protein